MLLVALYFQIICDSAALAIPMEGKVKYKQEYIRLLSPTFSLSALLSRHSSRYPVDLAVSHKRPVLTESSGEAPLIQGVIHEE